MTFSFKSSAVPQGQTYKQTHPSRKRVRSTASFTGSRNNVIRLYDTTIFRRSKQGADRGLPGSEGSGEPPGNRSLEEDPPGGGSLEEDPPGGRSSLEEDPPEGRSSLEDPPGGVSLEEDPPGRRSLEDMRTSSPRSPAPWGGSWDRPAAGIMVLLPAWWKKKEILLYNYIIRMRA